MKYLKSFNESTTGSENTTRTDVDYYKAAIHYFNNNLNNDRALEYINKAIELSDRKSNPYYLALKQMIEEKGPEPKFDSNEQQMAALQDLCDTNLAYLKDENFVVRIVQSRPDSFYIFIGLEGFNSSGTRDYFSWATVKDHIIPFFHYLLKDFKIQDTAKGRNERGISFVCYDTFNDTNESIKVDQILNDQIPDDKQIAGISIYVKSEYFI
jgi:hypothetical protein